MKRAFAGGLTVLVAACSATAAGAITQSAESTAASAPAGSVPPALIKDFVCHRARAPQSREISVTAVMRPISGTRRMGLRFDLLSRPDATSPFTPVLGGDLGQWISPRNPTLGRRPGDLWRVSHPVFDLPAPAVYRFRVWFRWIGARNKWLRTTIKPGPNCWQPELRPDLSVASITVKPAKAPTNNRYIVLIANNGASAAGQFQVLFADKGTQVSKSVPRLGPHKARQLVFVGPACDKSAAPTVTVDPAGQVDDYNTANNSLTATCP